MTTAGTAKVPTGIRTVVGREIPLALFDLDVLAHHEGEGGEQRAMQAPTPPAVAVIDLWRRLIDRKSHHTTFTAPAYWFK